MENHYEMPDPIQEKKRTRNGVEMPIDCLNRIVAQNKPNAKKRPPHYHDYIEFLFGTAECDVNAWIAGETVHFGTGDLLIVNANVPHEFEHRLPLNSYICIKVLPEVIYCSENPMYDVKYVVPFLQHNLLPYQFFEKEKLEGSRIPSILQDMMNCWTEQDYGYEIALKSLFLQVFLWVIRYNHRNGHAPMDPAADISFENIRLIQRSMEYINQNYADVTEADAAAHVNLSYSYFSKLFRRVVGKNFNDYLITVRVNEAERLLLSQDLSVTEIALATGFATSSHFIDKFKKAKGTTPKQYRLNWRK